MWCTWAPFFYAFLHRATVHTLMYSTIFSIRNPECVHLVRRASLLECLLQLARLSALETKTLETTLLRRTAVAARL